MKFSTQITIQFTERKGRFLSMLLGALGASLLGNMLAGKGINRAGEEFIRANHPKDLQSKRIFNTAPSLN